MSCSKTCSPLTRFPLLPQPAAASPDSRSALPNQWATLTDSGFHYPRRKARGGTLACCLLSGQRETGCFRELLPAADIGWPSRACVLDPTTPPHKSSGVPYRRLSPGFLSPPPCNLAGRLGSPCRRVACCLVARARVRVTALPAEHAKERTDPKETYAHLQSGEGLIPRGDEAGLGCAVGPCERTG